MLWAAWNATQSVYGSAHSIYYNVRLNLLASLTGYGNFVLAFNYGFVMGVVFCVVMTLWLLSARDKAIYDRAWKEVRESKDASSRSGAAEASSSSSSLRDPLQPPSFSALSWATIISDLTNGKLAVNGWAWTRKNVFFMNFDAPSRASGGEGEGEEGTKLLPKRSSRNCSASLSSRSCSEPSAAQASPRFTSCSTARSSTATSSSLPIDRV